jgi:hypothetical protein
MNVFKVKGTNFIEIAVNRLVTNGTRNPQKKTMCSRWFVVAFTSAVVVATSAWSWMLPRTNGCTQYFWRVPRAMGDKSITAISIKFVPFTLVVLYRILRMYQSSNWYCTQCEQSKVGFGQRFTRFVRPGIEFSGWDSRFFKTGFPVFKGHYVEIGKENRYYK